MNIKSMIFAFNAHSSVNHLYGCNPYSVHLTMVYVVALRHITLIPLADRDKVLDACFLHDVIEDTRLTYNDVVQR
jgi:(p)ppGpp synthase/HD superfamily hydrolase